MNALFRQQWLRCLDRLTSGSPPTRETYLAEADGLLQWRTEKGIVGLWSSPPLMATATIDDGWGHGLEVIERMAEAAGLRIHAIGLLRPPERIVAVCRRLEPDLLGLTVLQMDSDTTVAAVVNGLPRRTRLIAGGAAYRYDPGFADRTGTHAVAMDGRGFVQFLAEFTPEQT